MKLKAFRIENFRRLKSVLVNLDPETTVFVGANNSGKTSATHVFHLFLDPTRSRFQIYDFTADCWKQFNSFGVDPSQAGKLPTITLDLWFDVDDANLHRVIDLLPSLEWAGEPVGVRLTYGPRDQSSLLANYQEARKVAAPPEPVSTTSSYKPWPRDLTDYLSKRLYEEYEVTYSVLDASQVDEVFIPKDGYEPHVAGNYASGASRLVDSLLKVDFLDAQRHLSDVESRGRAEELSKRLGRYYQRNLPQIETDFAALSTIADSEDRLNEHFNDVFAPLMTSISELGYPGITNPGLIVKATLNPQGLLSGSARVHYAMPSDGDDDGEDSATATLPDQYNGLGFKNLIYMAIEILDFHHAWMNASGELPPVHLIMIEEPEAHLHAQLQQVFIRKVFELLPSVPDAFSTQLVITTHSAHVLYERSFKPVRYFCRTSGPGSLHTSTVKNLSAFSAGDASGSLDFLHQYLKLTHCDLFFADAAVLVEGNVERLIVPLLIERFVPELRACHLTILEVGGAFAHKFRELIEFLELTTLVITDLDSIDPSIQQEADDDGAPAKNAKACMTTIPDARTSNETLKQWVPCIEGVSELLAATNEQKVTGAGALSDGNVRVAYQTRRPATWKSDTSELAGRTLEEAFALENLELTQAPAGAALGLRISSAASLTLPELHERIFKRVASLDKTRFALELMSADDGSWVPPHYMVEGLQWLLARLAVEVEVVASIVPADEEA